MSEQIWATNVSDVRTNQSFLPKHFRLQEYRDAIVECSLGRKVNPELIADQYNFTGATKLSDSLPLPPVISLAHRCVTEPFKAVIEQFDIGQSFSTKPFFVISKDSQFRWNRTGPSLFRNLAKRLIAVRVSKKAG
ncbi:hypothetical protein [Octadecabacter ascidiaceicola]|uniref:hypothetical protein n=1 Tax=Octadecabacter ascidiaceicola TaxID=1655543 RepID=UPI0011805FDF|nr:hypothetical protein [Octadecabacter ascidiaceicola]